MRWVAQLCLMGAFVGTGYAAFASVAAWRVSHRTMRRSAGMAGIVSFILLGIVVTILATALITKDFRFAYVAQYCSRHLPWYYSLSALWVGQAGSLLLWSWFSIFVALAYWGSSRRQPSALREPTFGVLMALCWFLLATTVFAADPTAASFGPLREGRGLSPLLQHPKMLIHPPIIFLGYATWGVPFALAVTALCSGKLDAAWTREARRWALLAWALLGAGILLGAQWAYEELGWGGYWGWDPVENGSLMPWLTGTALIHAMMVWQRRGILKKTALSLAIATFGMCNFATFLTRSGVFSSLHAFSQSPIGWLFLVLMVVLGVGGGVLIVLRRDSLRPENTFERLLCREAMIVLSLIALLSLAVVICIGTLSMALSNAILGHGIVVGVEFYNNVFMVTGILLLVVTGTAPLLRWGAAPTRSQTRMLWLSISLGIAVALLTLFSGVTQYITLLVVGLAVLAVTAILGALVMDGRRRDPQRFWRGLLPALAAGRRQYAAYLIHVGLYCLAIGITCSSLGTERLDTELRVGETIRWAGRTIGLTDMIEREHPDKLVAEARLEVSQDGRRHFTLHPARHYHFLQEEWTTEVAIRPTWSGDLYAILHGAAGDGGVRLTLFSNPMMRWIWLGGLTMIVGAIVAVLPARAPSIPTSRVPKGATKGGLNHADRDKWTEGRRRRCRGSRLAVFHRRRSGRENQTDDNGTRREQPLRIT